MNVSALVKIVRQLSLSRKSFYHAGKECISLIQYLSGPDDHLPEGRSLGLRNTNGSCVPNLDYTPENCIYYFVFPYKFLHFD